MRLLAALRSRLSIICLLVAAGGCVASGNKTRDDLVRTNNVDSTTATTAPRAPDVMFLGTPNHVVREMLSLANVGANDTLFDLGSGDGRIVIEAARRGARAIGIDIDPELVEDSWRNAEAAGVRDKVEFRQGDLFETNLRGATALTLYLLPDLNVKLRPRLFEELRPGTPVVSHNFPMGDWIPDSTVTMGGTQVFLWYIPADVSGTWEIQLDDGAAAPRWTLRLDQQFQVVSGVAAINGRELRLSRTRLRGRRLSFDVIDSSGTPVITRRVVGEVSGGVFTGTITSAGARSAQRFRAVRDS